MVPFPDTLLNWNWKKYVLSELAVNCPKVIGTVMSVGVLGDVNPCVTAGPDITFLSSFTRADITVFVLLHWKYAWKTVGTRSPRRYMTVFIVTNVPEDDVVVFEGTGVHV